MPSSVRSKRNAAEFKKQFDQEQRQADERRMAPIKAIESELQANARKLAQAERELKHIDVFNQPSPELQKRCIAYKADPANPQTPEQITVAIQDAVNAFKLALSQNGVDLTESGTKKINLIARANSMSDLRLPETWRKFYDYANELGIFNRTDRIVQEKLQPAPVQESQERDLADYSDAEVEAIDSTTENGRKLLRRIADAKILKGRIYPMLNAWIESLESQWGVVFDTQQQKVALIRAVEDLFRKRSLPFVAKSFDLARVLLSNEGRVLPQGLLLPDEQLSQRINLTDDISSNHSAKVEYALEIKKLREAEELKQW